MLKHKHNYYILSSSMTIKVVLEGSTIPTGVELDLRSSAKAVRSLRTPSLATTPRMVWHCVPVRLMSTGEGRMKKLQTLK